MFLENEALFNPVSTVGQNVELSMKFYAASTAAQVVNVFSFYDQIIQINPVTRMYEVSAV